MAHTPRSNVWTRIHEALSIMDRQDRDTASGGETALRDLWRRRAAELARPQQEAEDSLRWEKVIILRIGKERYAFRVDDVEEIMRLLPITPVPCVPPYLLGVVNRRGSILPIVDLQVFFGGSRSPETRDSRIVVLSRNKLTLGLMVEAADQIVSIPAQGVMPPLRRDEGPQEEFCAGVVTLGTRMVVLIDSAKLLRDDKMKVDQAP
jgi:purine-binding chemotaxis protein CheW